MKKILVPLLVVFMMFAAVPGVLGFEDTPAPDKWVYDNFMTLYRSGLLKGYPDNTFRGERKATRYEMVELTARVLRYLEENIDKKYATEQEVKELFAASMDNPEDAEKAYNALKNLENEFKNELDSMDVKITTLEKEVDTAIKTGNEAMKEAKRAKIIGIIGIIAGIAGIFI